MDQHSAERDLPRIGQGPIFSVLGLSGWLLIAVAFDRIWDGYSGESDPVRFRLFVGSIATGVVVLAGGAASVSSCVAGGVMSVGRLLRSHRPDLPSVVSVVATLLGLLPVAWVVFKILTD